MHRTPLRTLLPHAFACTIACAIGGAVVPSAFAADPVATPAPTPVSTQAPSPGAPPIRKLDGHLVDLKGRGLYTWDGDKVLGQSACSAQCRLLWPPIVADDAATPAGPFTVATRPDGTRQWALRGRPLYRWASDKKYGDAGGDQVAGSWHLVKVAPPARPAAAPVDGSASPATDAGKALTGKTATDKTATEKAAAPPRPPAG
jgi:predicted lipoprotein with Yx(FWY)xxD motif